MSQIRDARWYDKTGKGCHEMPSADGKRMVKTTLVHAKKFNLYPSVTTKLSIIDKPQLVDWKVTTAVEYASQFPRAVGESPKDYAKRCMDQAFANTTGAAAERGSEIHRALEVYINTGEYLEGFEEDVKGAVAAIYGATGVNLGDTSERAMWLSECTIVSNTYGTAGTADLHCPSRRMLLDFKTKDMERTNPTKKLAYDQNRQLAIYADQLARNNGTHGKPWRCLSVFVSRTDPGYSVVHEWTQDEIEYGLEVFARASALWDAVYKYNVRAG